MYMKKMAALAVLAAGVAAFAGGDEMEEFRGT